MEAQNQRKFLWISIITFVIILAIGLFWSATRQKKSTPPFDQVRPSQPAVTVIPTNTEPLTIVDISPVQDDSIKHLPIVQIQITFNQPVSSEGFYYSISPEVETFVTVEGNTVTLSPSVTWQPGITTLDILPTTVSISGNVLNSSKSYQFNTGFEDGV